MTPAKVERIEITLSPDRAAALDAARGHEPRASFIKRALESALSAAETREGDWDKQGAIMEQAMKGKPAHAYKPRPKDKR